MKPYLSGCVNEWRRRVKMQKCILIIKIISLGLAAMLSACASTEELYAEYEHQCRVSIVNNASGSVVVDNADGGSMLWEPAIYFNYDKDSLLPEEYSRLDADVAVLEQYTELKIDVRGFTDSIASAKYNVALATRRVDRVIAYLVSKGIAEQRIRRAPLGEVLPLADNDSYESRAINRRVELLLLDSTGRAAPIRLKDNDKGWLGPKNQSQPGTEKDWRR